MKESKTKEKYWFLFFTSQEISLGYSNSVLHVGAGSDRF
jgi:hypothetical protein